MSTPPKLIPVSQPTITAEDKLAVMECLDQNFISGDSPVVVDFERKFARTIGRDFGVSVTNGSAALDVVLHSLDLVPGDEVIVPAFTIASCLFAILRANAVPIFVDCDESTWNMSLETVLPKISSRTRAILMVHTYGLSVDVEPIMRLCESRSIVLIEDAAEAHGVKYRGKNCGSFGLASTFSFYANKAITTGEGGMVLTDDEDFSERIRAYKNLAFLKPPGRRFVHDELGWNLRLSSLQAALGISQVDRLEDIVKRKREIGLSYSERLRSNELLGLQVSETPYSKNMYWVFGVVVDDRLDVDTLAKALRSEGIDTRPFFHPLHRQPVLTKFGLERQDLLPVSEKIGRQGFYLPSFLQISSSEIELVVKSLEVNLQRLAR